MKKKSVVTLSILLLIASILLAEEFQLNYGIQAELSLFPKGMKTITTSTRPDSLTENMLPERLRDAPILNSIAVGDEQIFLIDQIREGKNYLFVFNTYDNKVDSIKYIELNFLKTTDLKLNTPPVGNKHNCPIDFDIGILGNDFSYSRNDIRYGKININEHEFDFAILNPEINYSNMQKITVCIDFNNDGYFSEASYKDINGRIIKEIFPANNAFTVDNKDYNVLSVSKDGYNIDIMPKVLNTRLAEGYLLNNTYYTDKNNIKVNVRDIQAKAKLIFWWDNNCTAAKFFLPAVEQIYNQYKNNPDFKFYSFCNDSFEETKELMNSKNIRFPLYENEYHLEEFFDMHFPTVIIVDDRNIIRLLQQGYIITERDEKDMFNDPNYVEVREVLDGLLK
jgi:hypothetical protein